MCSYEMRVERGSSIAGAVSRCARVGFSIELYGLDGLASVYEYESYGLDFQTNLPFFFLY